MRVDEKSQEVQGERICLPMEETQETQVQLLGWDRTQYSCLETPHRQRSLAGYSLWGHKKSDMTEHAYMHISQFVKMQH